MDAYSRKGALSGDVIVPGSKSHTIRAVMLAALAEGTSVVHNPLPSKDGLAAMAAARALGAKVEVKENTWVITGVGGRPAAPGCVIDTMNSGTVTSFALGIGGLVDGYIVVTGDEQICRRPWKGQTVAMEELGATCIHTRPESPCPPRGGGRPHEGRRGPSQWLCQPAHLRHHPARSSAGEGHHRGAGSGEASGAALPEDDG